MRIDPLLQVRHAGRLWTGPCRVLLIVMLWLSLLMPLQSNAADDYGRPGDVFDLFHYPLLVGSPRQECPSLLLAYDRGTVITGGGPLVEGGALLFARYHIPWQVSATSLDHGFGVVGISFHGFPSNNRPFLLFDLPPHCLKKNGISWCLQ